MSKITVKEFSEQISVPVDRLLTQLGAAGLSVSKADDEISDEQKRQLLQHLQKRRGQNTGGEVVFQRSKTEEVSGIKVVVRKKRKVRRRSPEELEQLKIKAAEEALAAEQEEVKAKALQEEAAKKLEEEKQAREKLKEEVAAKDKAIKDKIEKEAPVPASAETSDKDQLHKKPKTSGFDESEDKTKVKKPVKKGAGAKTDKYTHFQADKISLSDEDEFVEVVEVVEPVKEAAPSKKSKRSKSSASVKNKHAFTKPKAKTTLDITVPESISVADLAQKLNVKAGQIIKVLMGMGTMATINEIIDQDTAVLIVEELGHKAVPISENAVEEQLMDLLSDLGSNEISRAPVVTIMGHVDHGKTSLLDYIRRTSVTDGEAGGITQHIGAYHVETEKGMITFLDTPGHSAFTAMRARGVKVTDIVILVVAADDGVMPQTIEAIKHAKAAEVSIIVAVNKIDKPDADPEKLKTELSNHNVVPEEWGGDSMFINLSAKTGEGVDALLDSILVQSEMMELKAFTDGPASGVVVEAKLDKGRGNVATVLVQQGTLRQGDILLAGQQHGRVRAMIDENGHKTSQAGPSIPVEVLGLSGSPNAGDEFLIVPDERSAREVAQHRAGQFKQAQIKRQQVATLDNMFENLKEGEKRTLNIVLKADVQGSVEALNDALLKLQTEDVNVKIVYSNTGGITESDANLALASSAVIFGFNVRADNAAKEVIAKEKLDLHYHSIIYDVIDEVKSAVLGLTAPKFEERIIGMAEVRSVFRSTKLGSIAGCMVIDGVVKRSNPIRVLRDNVVVFEGALESLKRFKEDAQEVRNGTECGIGVKNYNDVKEGDQIEVFETVEIKPQAQ
jgi:translation initiation factor IF-2